MKETTDIKHLVDTLEHHSRQNLISHIDATLEKSPAGTYTTAKEQYIESTRDILLALASGFRESSAWCADLVYFIGLADRLFAAFDPKKEEKKAVTNGTE